MIVQNHQLLNPYNNNYIPFKYIKSIYLWGYNPTSNNKTINVKLENTEPLYIEFIANETTNFSLIDLKIKPNYLILDIPAGGANIDYNIIIIYSDN